MLQTVCFLKLLTELNSKCVWTFISLKYNIERRVAIQNSKLSIFITTLATYFFFNKTSGVILYNFSNIESSDRSTDFFIPSIYLCNYQHITLLNLVYVHVWMGGERGKTEQKINCKKFIYLKIVLKYNE